jgi:hypothetical protein
MQRSADERSEKKRGVQAQIMKHTLDLQLSADDEKLLRSPLCLRWRRKNKFAVRVHRPGGRRVRPGRRYRRTARRARGFVTSGSSLSAGARGPRLGRRGALPREPRLTTR